jgi:hypothetical protein
MTATLEAVERLTKDIKESARTLTASEARFVVDNYYALQDFRMQTGAQYREMVQVSCSCKAKFHATEPRKGIEPYIWREPNPEIEP